MLGLQLRHVFSAVHCWSTALYYWQVMSGTPFSLANWYAPVADPPSHVPAMFWPQLRMTWIDGMGTVVVGPAMILYLSARELIAPWAQHEPAW